MLHIADASAVSETMGESRLPVLISHSHANSFLLAADFITATRALRYYPRDVCKDGCWMDVFTQTENCVRSLMSERETLAAKAKPTHTRFWTGECFNIDWAALLFASSKH